jgi:hypothetical protein
VRELIQGSPPTQKVGPNGNRITAGNAAEEENPFWGRTWGLFGDARFLPLRSVLEQAQIPANKGLDALGHEEKEAHARASLRRKQASGERRSRSCAKTI